MSGNPRYPSLYQINTRVWLAELSQDLGRKATLDDIPDSALDHLADMGFDWIWLLSVWTTGEKARKVSLEIQELRREFKDVLSDLEDEDIGGSGFAIANYHVHPNLGGDDALKRLRARLTTRGLKLMLDFVPNHMGPDHPWVRDHPDFFMAGKESDLANAPQNYTRVKRKGGGLILAYGRDPNYSGWSDTFQLDYSNPDTVEAMTRELLRISGQCDGVRCDMAMLILPDVFERTWGRKARSFWPEATKAVRKKYPDFCFLAEVYWDLEWEMQQQGFDYVYDKRLYERLIEGDAKAVREHFNSRADHRDKLARFLENHDEPRASAAFERKNHEAAAVITFLSPGLRFFHQGQFEGRKKRIPAQLVRAPRELPDAAIQKFYRDLLCALKMPVFRDGSWKLLECVSAWEGNGSWDSIIAFSWVYNHNEQWLVVVNYAPHDSQCNVLLPFLNPDRPVVRFTDLMSPAVYDRQTDGLLSNGLYLDLPPWGYHVFKVGSPM